tara:strand:+ start:5565 stop:6347 length:783 start_codon:yes stop_codon:yes gene_type:complete
MGRTKGVVKRAIVTPDKHFPLADMAAIDVLCQAIEIVKPDIYIDLGDVGEWHGCSHWQWTKRKRPPLEYQLPFIEQDIVDVNKGMDIIDESLDKTNCKEKYMIEGNHDDWMNRFVDEHPYLQEMRFKECVNLKQRGYKYYPAGKYLRIGKLWYYHGHHFAGVHHTRNHLIRTGANVMYGHHHDIQQTSITHMDGVKSAWSIGCLKDMSIEQNAWLGGRNINWSHAFAIVDYYENGFFTVHVIQIINGKTSLWGELLDGNK